MERPCRWAFGFALAVDESELPEGRWHPMVNWIFLGAMAIASDLESKKILNCESKNLELARTEPADIYKLTLEISKLHKSQRPFLSLSKNGTNISMSSNGGTTQIKNIGDSKDCHIKINHQFGPPSTRVELILMKANAKPIRNKFAPMLIELVDPEPSQKSQAQMYCELDSTLITKFCGVPPAEKAIKPATEAPAKTNSSSPQETKKK